MDTTNKLAVLIDVDNDQPSIVDGLQAEIDQQQVTIYSGQTYQVNTNIPY